MISQVIQENLNKENLNKENLSREPQQGEPQQGEPQQGEPQQGEPQQGEPQPASQTDTSPTAMTNKPKYIVNVSTEFPDTSLDPLDPLSKGAPARTSARPRPIGPDLVV